MPRVQTKISPCWPWWSSGWCSDVTSTHGAWGHAGVRFPLSGVFGENNASANSGAWSRSTDLWATSPTRQPLRHSWWLSCEAPQLFHESSAHSILPTNAHAGSRTRVTSMGGLYDTTTLRALTTQRQNKVTNWMQPSKPSGEFMSFFKNVTLCAALA